MAGFLARSQWKMQKIQAGSMGQDADSADGSSLVPLSLPGLSASLVNTVFLTSSLSFSSMPGTIPGDFGNHRAVSVKSQRREHKS